MKTENKHLLLLLLLLLNSVLLVSAYYVLAPVFPIYIPYLCAGAVMGFAFIIYNRGLVGKDITPDQLPDTMSPVEKQQFINDCKSRLKRSRWMLTIIFPIILTFAIDMMVLFLFPMLENMFL